MICVFEPNQDAFVTEAGPCRLALRRGELRAVAMSSSESPARSAAHAARNCHLQSSRSSPDPLPPFAILGGVSVRQLKRDQPVVPRRSKPTAPSPRVDDLLFGRGDPLLQRAGRPAGSKETRPECFWGHPAASKPTRPCPGGSTQGMKKLATGRFLAMGGGEREAVADHAPGDATGVLPGLPAAPRLSPCGSREAR